MSFTYRVIVKGKLEGQDIMNRLHFNRESFAEGDKQILATHVVDRILGQWRFLQVPFMRWNTVEVHLLGDEGDIPLIHPTQVEGFGLNQGGYFLPLAAVLQIKTNVSGRTGRGRIFIAANPANALGASVWNPIWMLQLQSVCDSHMQWFGPENPQSGFTMGVGKWTSEGVEFKHMTDIVPRAYPGTQVKRNFLRGT